MIKWISKLPLCAMLLPFLALAGPVNVNTADAETISRSLEGVGLSKARAIVEYRQKHGPFKSANDLSLVKGIGDRTVELNRENILEDSQRIAAYYWLLCAPRQLMRKRHIEPEDSRGRISGRRAGNPIPAGHQGQPQGNVANRRQTADPIRGRGGD